MKRKSRPHFSGNRNPGTPNQIITETKPVARPITQAAVQTEPPRNTLPANLREIHESVIADWRNEIGNLGPARSGISNAHKIILAVRDAQDIMPLIREFEKERCTLGLVLIAGFRDGNIRESAIRAIAHVSTSADLTRSALGIKNALEHDHTLLQMGHTDEFYLRTKSGRITFNEIYAEPEAAGKIALEEKSLALVVSVFFRHLKDLDHERTRPLFDFLVKTNNFDGWNAIDYQITGPHSIPDAWVIELGARIGDIAKARMRSILPRIAAIHPNETTRRKAIDAIKVGGVDGQNAHWCLISSAAQSKYPGTARYAIDFAVEMTVTEMKKAENTKMDGLQALTAEKEENDAYQKGATRTRQMAILNGYLDELFEKQVVEEIREYGLRKLFELWSEYRGYDHFSYDDHKGHPDALQAIQAHLEGNFERLVTNREVDSLEWLVERNSSLASRAITALGMELEGIKGLRNIRMLGMIGEKHPDHSIREKASGYATEIERANEKRVRKHGFESDLRNLSNKVNQSI